MQLFVTFRFELLLLLCFNVWFVSKFAFGVVMLEKEITLQYKGKFQIHNSCQGLALTTVVH